jgi:hypothetical protein
MAERGAQKEPFRNGHWNGGGVVSWTTFLYERVTITYLAGFALTRRDANWWPSTTMMSQNQKKKRENSKRGFSLYHGSNADMVIIYWNDRKCAGRSEAKR